LPGARPAVLILPERAEWIAAAAAPTSFLLVAGAAVVARQLPNNLVLHRALPFAHDLLALDVEIAQPSAQILGPRRHVHTLARTAQRAREQPRFIAVTAVELHLGGAHVAIELTHLAFDPRQRIAALVAALALDHEPLLELEANIAACWRSLRLDARRQLTWRRRAPRLRLLLRTAVHGLARLWRPTWAFFRGPRPPAALRLGGRHDLGAGRDKSGNDRCRGHHSSDCP
jgi:hypothetical protein